MPYSEKNTLFLNTLLVLTPRLPGTVAAALEVMVSALVSFCRYPFVSTLFTYLQQQQYRWRRGWCVCVSMVVLSKGAHPTPRVPHFRGAVHPPFPLLPAASNWQHMGSLPARHGARSFVVELTARLQS